MKDALADVDRNFRRFAPPSQHAALEKVFRRQEKILRSLPDYPGYRFTVIASRELVLDIEESVEGIQKKLDSNIFSMARRALDTLIDIFKNGNGPLALVRGLTG
ncbi:hypothetical protein [Mycolicibacterium vaccae]|uniref:Uncharacterized protein n=1 Tax=Mycolicibacterium vaccae ATCC 25954 TaxID=1194972 RepID=K0UTD3_MYCVA|nr:hypothetical protein [Mycolicibacterium vaccae]EJZ05863.1 hypothetical protein MVAC_23830 [Mycolicibacterium vaccae ATCC 25954]MCV7064207.1 hypothetical protein [Mycolicibacterium vaccae]